MVGLKSISFLRPFVSAAGKSGDLQPYSEFYLLEFETI